MGEKRNAYRILVGKAERKGSLGRPRRRWIIIERILEKLDEMVRTELIWLRIGTSGGLLGTW
jgi:hypothetical protein